MDGGSPRELAHSARQENRSEHLRNQDDLDNLIGDTRWTTRRHYDDYLAWRTVNGFTAAFDDLLERPMLIGITTRFRSPIGTMGLRKTVDRFLASE